MPPYQTNAPLDMIPSPTVIMREEDEEVKPYVIVAEIGKGSFATVYKGYHSVSLSKTLLAYQNSSESFR
jgi:serine/threonine-protein kinase ULK/ATG1